MCSTSDVAGIICVCIGSVLKWRGLLLIVCSAQIIQSLIWWWTRMAPWMLCPASASPALWLTRRSVLQLSRGHQWCSLEQKLPPTHCRAPGMKEPPVNPTDCRTRWPSETKCPNRAPDPITHTLRTSFKMHPLYWNYSGGKRRSKVR